MGSFFQKSKLAALTTTGVFFGSFFVVNFFGDQELSEVGKTLLSILPPQGLTFASNNLMLLESNDLGVRFSNLNSLREEYRLFTYYWMTAISIVLFILAGLYLENVLPTSPGIRKSLWFPFTKSFWGMSSRRKNFSVDNQPTQRLFESTDSQLNAIRESYFEPRSHDEIEMRNNDQCVLVEGISKRFGKDKAVSHFTAEMYEGQIFALLGHNGAGKSTLVNILSGMLELDEGHAYIYGYDIKTQI